MILKIKKQLSSWRGRTVWFEETWVGKEHQIFIDCPLPISPKMCIFMG